MRVLVMGTGGVGSYYGGILADSGNDVTFIARGAHLEAMRQRGLELRTGGRTIHLNPVKAFASPAEAGTDFDLVLFTVKTYDTEAAAEAIRPAVSEKTSVLPLQNGIDSVDLLSNAVGREHVLAGVTFVASAVIEPGVAQENGFSRRVVLGEPSGSVTPRAEAVATVLRNADVEVEVRADAMQAVWEKFVLLAPHASVSSACQLPVGDIFRVPEAVELYRTLIREVKAVGEASGFQFKPDIEDSIITMFKGAPPTQMSSMQRDFAAQRRVELEYLIGTVIRRARQFGILTPAFDVLYAVLKTRAISFGGIPAS
jgi:2-dehydropantoate 2-reductase